jgi:hypothetical protein
MAFGGDDDRRGKRKMTEPHDKDPPRRGHGRTTAGRGAARDRGRRDQLIQEEENLERVGIPSLLVLVQIPLLILRSLTEATLEITQRR